MAMSESTLSSAIQSELTAAGFNLGDAPNAKALCDAIAKAVVGHIVQNAQVTTVVASGSSAGSYTGSIS